MHGEGINSTDADLPVKIFEALERLGGHDGTGNGIAANAIATGTSLTSGFQDLKAGGITVYGNVRYIYENNGNSTLRFDTTVMSALDEPVVAQAPTPTTGAPAATTTQAPTSVPSTPSATQRPVPASAGGRAAEIPSVMARRIGDDLEAALEQALGVDLALIVQTAQETVQEFDQRLFSNLEIVYWFNDDLPPEVDLTAKSTEMLKGLGATITQTSATSGGVGHIIEGLQIGGVTADGGITFYDTGTHHGAVQIRLNFEGPELVPSGRAGAFIESTKPALEQALGVDLAVVWVQDHTQNPLVDPGMVRFSYHTDEPLPGQAEPFEPISDDLQAKILGALEGLGTSISYATAGSGNMDIAVEGLKAGELTGGGNVVLGPDINRGGSMVQFSMTRITSGQ